MSVCEFFLFLHLYVQNNKTFNFLFVKFFALFFVICIKLLLLLLVLVIYFLLLSRGYFYIKHGNFIFECISSQFINECLSGYASVYVWELNLCICMYMVKFSCIVYVFFSNYVFVFVFWLFIVMLFVVYAVICLVCLFSMKFN